MQNPVSQRIARNLSRAWADQPMEEGMEHPVSRRLSTRTRIALYGVVPFIGIASLAVFYFSDVQLLRSIVSPARGKEFGLLESLQNALLLGSVGIAALGVRRVRGGAVKAMLATVFLGTLFLLLEETDYGAHYLGTQTSNLHSLGYLETVLESAAQFGMMIFFGAFAILFADSRHRLLRAIAPDRFCVLTIFVISALQEVIWRMPAVSGTLSGHEIEFTELGMYYLVLIYVMDLVFWRGVPSREASDNLSA
jgi:hypothetical protein